MGGKLTAGGTAVGPLARVPHAVLDQLPLHVEGLAALIAGEDLLGRVRLLVLLQVTEVTEPCRGQTAVQLRTGPSAPFESKRETALPRPQMSHKCGFSPEWMMM